MTLLCIVLVCLSVALGGCLFIILRQRKQVFLDLAGIAHDLSGACGIVQQASALQKTSGNVFYTDMLTMQSAYIVLLCRTLCTLVQKKQTLGSVRRLGDASLCVRDICMQMECFLQTKNVELEFESRGSCTARFDALSLQRIVQNLILNACEAAQGRGRIHVVVDGAGDQDSISILVRDDGHGIPQDKLHTIFLPHATDKRQQHLHGLGLPSAARLAALHKGSLRVQSQEGVGSCFCFSFPR